MLRIIVAAFALCLFSVSSAFAHFGIALPSRNTIMERKDADIRLDLAFAHPFSRQGMAMAKPRQFFVRHNGANADLLSSLVPAEFWGESAWRTDYKLKTPGVYVFAVEPEPYYEPAEDSFIIHYAKTVVAAYGGEDGWDEPTGLPAEIIPLSRPFANYAGNAFVGKALLNGAPLAGAVVEVEYLNLDGERVAPDAYYETQTVKTDENGVFVFGVPWAGWWGFAVLCEGPEKMEYDGEARSVELGGVLWARFDEPLFKNKDAK